MRNPDRMTDEEKLSELRKSGWPGNERNPFIDTLWVLFILLAIFMPAGHAILWLLGWEVIWQQPK